MIRSWPGLCVVLAGCFLVAIVLGSGGCDIDGVTPNCPPDGGDCLTAPGDANPVTTDAGTD
jgi:hypothetical protein